MNLFVRQCIWDYPVYLCVPAVKIEEAIDEEPVITDPVRADTDEAEERASAGDDKFNILYNKQNGK